MIRGGITTTGREGALAGSMAFEVNPTVGGGTTDAIGFAAAVFSTGLTAGLATGFEGKAFLIGLRNSTDGFPRPLAGADFMRLTDLVIGEIFLADRAGTTFFIGSRLLPSPDQRGKVHRSSVGNFDPESVAGNRVARVRLWKVQYSRPGILQRKAKVR
jgi:hypothetical protein